MSQAVAGMPAVQLSDLLGVGALAAATLAVLRAISNTFSRTPVLRWQRNAFNQAVLSRCPALRCRLSARLS